MWKICQKYLLHHSFEIQQWPALNGKPKRSLNQCYFNNNTQTHKRIWNGNISYFDPGNWPSVNRMLWITNDTKARTLFLLFIWGWSFGALWALLPNRLPHKILSTKYQIYKKCIQTNINYITVLCQKKLITRFQWRFIISSLQSTPNISPMVVTTYIEFYVKHWESVWNCQPIERSPLHFMQQRLFIR